MIVYGTSLSGAPSASVCSKTWEVVLLVGPVMLEVESGADGMGFVQVVRAVVLPAIGDVALEGVLRHSVVKQVPTGPG